MPVIRIAAAGPPIEIVDGEEVLLGRLSTDDRIASALDRFDDVSRYHARITVREDRVEVAELPEARNGTFVDNYRLPPGISVFVLPTMIRLGSACYVSIERHTKLPPPR